MEWTDEDEEIEKEKQKVERYKKMVILKHMFTREELENSPELVIDITEDIREECSRVGDVLNVTLYDVQFLLSFIIIN